MGSCGLRLWDFYSSFTVQSDSFVRFKKITFAHHKSTNSFQQCFRSHGWNILFGETWKPPRNSRRVCCLAKFMRSDGFRSTEPVFYIQELFNILSNSFMEQNIIQQWHQPMYLYPKINQQQSYRKYKRAVTISKKFKRKSLIWIHSHSYTHHIPQRKEEKDNWQHFSSMIH